MGSGTSQKREIQFNCSDLQEKQFMTNREDVICPICLDFPHNAVLLRCSSYDKGCRPFMCDTNHTHSNCLDRFKGAYGLATTTKESSTPSTNIHAIPSNSDSCPTCPLCRGDVTGWVVIDEARAHWNSKKRCCEERHCSYVGNFAELQIHAQQEHPHACPSEIDPARQLDWENFQQSSEIVDVLSTIQSQVPRGVVLGDYVIEYGDESGDDYEDFPGDEGNWWTSCILYQVFDNFRASRNRRRSRASETRRARHRSAYEVSYVDEGSTASVDIAEFRYEGSDDEFVGAGDGGEAAASGSASHRSYRRRRYRFHEP